MAAGELSRWWRFGLQIITPVVHVLFRVRIVGVEHVPARGAAIVAFNHVSALDGPALAVELSRRTKRETQFLVAAEFFRKFFFGWVLRTFDQIPIRRGAADAGALDIALESLRDGAVVAIAPEGGVNPEAHGELQRIRGGVARLALPTGVPIVPVGLWGTQAHWPRTGIIWSRLWRRPLLAIVFGPPILPDGDASVDADVEDLKERIRVRLLEQVTEARALAGDPVR